MADLHPTKSRIYLLRAVGSGDVYCARQSGGRQQVMSFLRVDSRNVTARAEELEKAGWVRRGRHESASMFSRRFWELTEAGRKVLEEADRAG